MRYIKNISIIAVVAALLMSCKEESAVPAENQPSVEVEQQTESQQLPTFLNGEPVLGFNQSAYAPSSDADMELLSLHTGLALHYFDRDDAFLAFCESTGRLNIYEANAKLDLVYFKAEELGLLEENGAKGEDDVVPQEMADFWYELFGYDIEKGDGSKANFVTRVSAACIPGDFYSVENDWFILPMKRTLGKMNGKVSSIRVQGTVGTTVFCHKKWFGAPRKLISIMVSDDFFYSVCGTGDDKKFHSFFTI